MCVSKMESRKPRVGSLMLLLLFLAAACQWVDGGQESVAFRQWVEHERQVMQSADKPFSLGPFSGRLPWGGCQ
jgi:hypothetical protein